MNDNRLYVESSGGKPQSKTSAQLQAKTIVDVSFVDVSNVHGIVVKKFSSVSFMRHFYASQSIISMDFQVISEFFPFSRIQLLINFLHRVLEFFYFSDCPVFVSYK